MTDAARSPLELFQFPRMFAIPNLSLFCCKLETWLRITRIPYEVVDTPDPRKRPKGKLPFIEEGGVPIADSSRILAYTHLLRDEGFRHTRTRFDSVPAIIRPLITTMVQRQIRGLLWTQGILRHSDEEIVEAALRDWRAVLPFMSPGPFFFGDKPCGLDAIVFGTLAITVLTPIESPIRDILRAQPPCLAYAERMRGQYFPELAHGQD